MSFQENLRYYRERAGYKSAREFAEVLNIPYATYAGYEYKNREAKYPMLIKIAKLLNVSIDDLLGLKNNILGKNDNEQILELLNSCLNSGGFKGLLEGLDETPKIKIKSIDDNYIIFNLSINANKEFENISVSKQGFITQIRMLEELKKSKIKDCIFYEVFDNVKAKMRVEIEQALNCMENSSNKEDIKSRLSDLDFIEQVKMDYLKNK